MAYFSTLRLRRGSHSVDEEHRMNRVSRNSLQRMPSVRCTSVYKQLDTVAPDMRTEFLAGEPSKLMCFQFICVTLISESKLAILRNFVVSSVS